jgi:steroid delta-isomerase-like uncharacterized protein
MNASETIQKMISAINKHDSKAVTSQYEANALVYDSFYPEPLKGRSDIEKDIDGFFRAFPDLHVESKNIIENKDTFAIEVSMTGTNDGSLSTPDGDLPSTGKKVNLRMAVFGRVNQNGEITEERRYYNVIELLKQLGLEK